MIRRLCDKDKWRGIQCPGQALSGSPIVRRGSDGLLRILINSPRIPGPEPLLVVKML